ncbi:MAG: hypothetical protein Q4D51_01195 [Eubacteriales bacterium]|nr:hypothetical protein [Eubacteriales bacterium]
MEGKSIYYILGMIAGLLVAVLLIALITFLTNKVGGRVSTFKKSKDSYDERQLLVRGQAFKTGFFVLCVYVMVAAIMDSMSGNRLLLSTGGIWVGVCSSIFVFAVICIVKDAYIAIQDNAKGMIILFVAIAVINFMCKLGDVLTGRLHFLEKNVSLVDGKMIESMSISMDGINIITGLLLLLTALVLIGKVIYDKKHVIEEDEE